MASGLRTASLFYYGRKFTLKLPSVRDTSVSDLWLIGFWPCTQDTLKPSRRWERPQQMIKKFSAEESQYKLYPYQWHIKITHYSPRLQLQVQIMLHARVLPLQQQNAVLFSSSYFLERCLKDSNAIQLQGI